MYLRRDGRDTRLPPPLKSGVDNRFAFAFERIASLHARVTSLSQEFILFVTRLDGRGAVKISLAGLIARERPFPRQLGRAHIRGPRRPFGRLQRHRIRQVWNHFIHWVPIVRGTAVWSGFCLLPS